MSATSGHTKLPESTWNHAHAVLMLWRAFAAMPGARCPDCNALADTVRPTLGHAGFCEVARALRASGS